MTNKCENCGKCCLETEMILSKQDLNLILNNASNNLNEDDVVFKNNDDFLQLKNSSGHCVFFDMSSKECKIYKLRPQGCKFYPLIYDRDNHKCIIDKDCPRSHLFYQNHEDFVLSCQKLKSFLKVQLKIKT